MTSCIPSNAGAEELGEGRAYPPPNLALHWLETTARLGDVSSDVGGPNLGR